ncbi:PAP2 superfamily protein [Frondihabitans sp. PhB188]|uniref:phosphatase PAP2 family protein n=1 Tax=Frondihabitans sp. PhB188 TaxID=2485200 RepID=UPI000F4746C8|nr:phosphatase PAP2 family protein [Frondihabitans sp. PhB188]ROQ39858.1 PAP2 superfamily protein [Frondihabitans sp. PhB188]
MRTRPTRRAVGTAAVAALAAVALVATPIAATAATSYPSDTTAPALTPLLTGYNQFWTSDGKNDLHGSVEDNATLALNDRLAVWINNNATAKQQFRALQNSEYQTSDGTAYDQSVSIADGLGSVISKLYVKGTVSGDLPLTTALVNSSTGTSGAYVGTSVPKAAFSYPRPYLPSDASSTAVSGDAAGCAPATVNASSVQSNRTGKSYADAAGNLKIKRVADTVDATHEFSNSDVALSAGYGTVGICTGGSYPSGHTTTAYQAGLSLAELLPELAPEILARTSEAGNNRIVLGVHYPLDIVGGRISGEAALATRMSDAAYVKGVIAPARAELVAYIKSQTHTTLAKTLKTQKSYADNPYGGKKMPGGTAQIVTDRRSAVNVYTDRLTYAFPKTGATGAAASVPAGASSLLLTAYPTLTDAQRTSVLAQTEIASGFPLDQTRKATGSWERLNLAKAISAIVQVNKNGTVKVLSTGGVAKVVKAVK